MSCSRKGFSILGGAPDVVVRLRFGEVLSTPIDILRWWNGSFGEVDMERLRDTSLRSVSSPFWGILMFSVREETGMVKRFGRSSLLGG